MIAAAEARGLSKSFGRLRALDNVSFDLKRGEVHAIAGENGAGKSTLIKIFSGATAPDAGDLLIRGRPVRFKSPADSARHGIATIHQELSLIGSMSVAENLFLAEERGLFGVVRRDDERRRAQAILDRLGFAIPASIRVEDLPLSAQQLVEIARALAAGAEILLFDEPTSALGDAEARSLLSKIRELCAKGASAIYISHRMEEIYAIADRITVLRDGALIVTAAASELPRDELVATMVGRRASSLPLKSRAAPKEGDSIVLRVEGLRVARAAHQESARDARSAAPLRHDVDDLSFSIRRGEIVGLAGLRGSGATEVLHGIFGALGGRASGKIEIGGRILDIGRSSPEQSIRNGITLLTNDRKSAGLFMDLSGVENATMACLRRFAHFGWIRRIAERIEAASTLDRLRLRALSIDAPVRGLSGGNQQKVYLARCLLASPRILLLDEPTRGVDIAAKADIHSILRELAESGAAILLAASEMDELISLCDRILVLHRGRLMVEQGRDDASRSSILAAAMGPGEIAP